VIHQETVHRQAEARLEARKKERAANEKQLASLRAGKGFVWSSLEDVLRVATRARRLGFGELAAALLRDPEDREIGNRVFEKILGENDLLGVTFLSEGARMSRAVGRIRLPVAGGTRLGTGFMVSPRVLLTNNHVLEDEDEARRAQIEFDFFVRESGTTGPVTTFRLEPDRLFLTDGPLDFSFVAVQPVNDANAAVRDRGWFPLLARSGKALVGERVSIIQHPNGEPQKVTVHDNKIVDVSEAYLHYRTDTMGGSSGSPVLNINWDLAALHHAAVGDKNEGVRISSIVARLREMLTEESVRPDRDLVGELLDAPSPPAPTPTPTPSPSRRPDEGPEINPDGSASWIVPVRVTLGLGPGAGVSAAGVDVKAPSTAPSSPSAGGLDLQDALDALEATAGRVYYAATEDAAQRKAYYPSLDGLSGRELQERLSRLLRETHTTTLGYRTARLRHLYPWIDRREDRSRKLRGIYSNDVFDALEVIRQEVAMERAREQAMQERLQNESLGPVDDTFLEELEARHPFNCEHVVPQSWFDRRKQPKTDLHHLFTCEWKCNSFRGNRAYFDFSTEAFREDCGESGKGKFEPQAGKGAVARATLYFLLRYPGEIADSTKEMPRDRLETLVAWAAGDKIDRWERHRNAEIQKVQGNRNPLIDFPELADRIDFSGCWA
jgi:endonuclease G